MSALLEDIARLFHAEPALGALSGFRPEELADLPDLLGAVLAGLLPDPGARPVLRDLARAAFRADAGALSAALEDLEVTAARDIDTGGPAQVLLFAPGYQGLLSYRLSRALLMAGQGAASTAVKAQLGRALCVDIAPQAQIGRRVWLDHGLGVVIGRTAVIGDDVSLWHGVTLGSNLTDRGAQRHPRIGEGAVLGAQSTILGGIEIGAGAVVAAGAVVTRPVPPGVTVYGPKATVRSRQEGSFGGFGGV